MTPKVLSNLMTRLRSLAGLSDAGQMRDQELLERFIRQHDEVAFSALVERHGAMVYSVCKRMLEHHQDAEDASQATFLILVRRGSSIRKLNSLSSWLHGVALRMSMKLRAQHARARQIRDGLIKNQDESPPRLTGDEMGAALDEELQHLPEKFRAPLILCYLQTKTRDEAAEELGLELSTLKGRLEWGRKLLRDRLVRRGVALSTAFLAGSLGQASAAMPSLLSVHIVQVAGQVAGGKAVASVAAPQVAALVQGFLHGVLIHKIQVAAAVLLVAIGISGSGWYAVQGMTGIAETDGTAQVAVVPQPESRQPETPKPKPLPQLEPEPEPLIPMLPPIEDAAPNSDEEPMKEPEKKVIKLPLKEESLVRRGEHLTKNVFRCADCHAPRSAHAVAEVVKHLQALRLKGKKHNEHEREFEHKKPDLTRSSLVTRWTEAKMVAFLAKPRRGLTIAAHHLPADDARAVAAYLRSLSAMANREKRKGYDD